VGLGGKIRLVFRGSPVVGVQRGRTAGVMFSGGGAAKRATRLSFQLSSRLLP
jgi:hypothetical protein